jgi:hypothetical protein
VKESKKIEPLIKVDQELDLHYGKVDKETLDATEELDSEDEQNLNKDFFESMTYWQF